MSLQDELNEVASGLRETLSQISSAFKSVDNRLRYLEKRVRELDQTNKELQHRLSISSAKPTIPPIDPLPSFNGEEIKKLQSALLKDLEEFRLATMGEQQ